MPFRCLMRADQVDARASRRRSRRGLPDGVDGRGVGIAEGPRRDGEGPARRARSARRTGCSRPPASTSASSCSSAIPARRGTTSKRRCSWRARSSPTTSASRCRIRCRARKFYERVRQELGAKQNWFDSSDLAMMYRATYAPEFYRALHDVVHHEFRARQVRERAVGARRARPWAIAARATLRRAASWIYNRAGARR